MNVSWEESGMHKQRSRVSENNGLLPCLRFSFVSDCPAAALCAEEQGCEGTSKRSITKISITPPTSTNNWFPLQQGLSWSTRDFTQEDEKRVPVAWCRP